MLKNRLQRAAAALLLLTCYLVLTGSALIDPDQVEQKGAEYTTAIVERGDYIRTASGGGSLYYPVIHEVRCKVRNARLSAIYVGRSDELTEGELLGTFTSEGSRAALTEARLSLTRAEEEYALGIAEREEAITEANRALSGQADQTDREIANLRIEQMQADLDAYRLRREYAIAGMRENIAEMEEALKDVDVYAPVTGKIQGYSYLNVGDSVYYNQQLLYMSDSSIYLIRIEDDYAKFRYGMRLKVSYGPRNKRSECEAIVVSADNVLPYSERRGYAYALALGAEIPDGDFTMINVEGEQVRVDDVLLIPKRATTLEGGKNYVSILDGASIAKRYVNVALSNTDSSWILQGLEEGQSLILD